ncbi:MAG: hypothetical protein HYY24_11850 [Verrucomicrobia bacterium]|nr:hypothetical protein [Verrucomicrobiota bacterium]
MNSDWLKKADERMKIGGAAISLASGCALLGTALAGPTGTIAGAVLGGITGLVTAIAFQPPGHPKLTETSNHSSG